MQFVHRLVLGMLGIGHGFDAIRIARRTADIFRRDGTGGFEEHGAMTQLGIARQFLIDLDSVFPVIIEVVDVLESSPLWRGFKFF